MDVLMPFARSGGGGSVVSGALLAQTLHACGLNVLALFPQAGSGAKVFGNYGTPVQFSELPELRPVDARTRKGKVRTALPAARASSAIFPFALRFMRTHRPKVVHINDDSTLIPWGVAARILGIPVVWHVRQIRRGALDRVRIRLATVCISISHAVTARLRDAPIVETIYNPVDTERFHPRADAHVLKRAFGMDGFITLLFVGRPVPYKRASWALHALEHLVDAGVDARLVILGEWSLDDVDGLLRTASPGVRRSIQVVQHTTEPELYFAAADILLHPAYAEPFGRVIVEAQASGLPPVATRSGGPLEIIDHGRTGFLTDPDAPGEFTELVAKLAHDRALRETMGGAAAVDASRRFGMETYRIAIESFYERNVLRGTAPRGWHEPSPRIM